MLAVATGMATAHDPPSDNPRGTPEEVQRATSEDICVRAAEEEGVLRDTSWRGARAVDPCPSSGARCNAQPAVALVQTLASDKADRDWNDHRRRER